MIKKLLERTEVVLAVALLLPFLLQVDVKSIKFLIEACLGIVFFFSIRPFFKHRFSFAKNLNAIFASVAISYLLLSGVYLLLATLLLRGSGLWTGYFLIAIVPPAISIVPMCYLSRCNPEVADSSIFVAYLLSLVIIPISLLLVYGKSVDFLVLARILLILMILPGVLSWSLRKSKSIVFRLSKAIINSCLGVVIFISVSLNKGAFFDFSNPQIIIIYLINFIAIFGTGFIVFHTLKHSSGFETAVNYGLYASQKNVGTSITIGLMLFAPTVAVPAIIALAMQFVFFILFERVILVIDK
jgi:predicted Na+-dependent transporter